MFSELRASLGLLVLLTFLTGVLYPALMLGAGHVLFPYQANGSLEEANGTIIGSSLIGQKFTDNAYFHGRPSSAGDGYDATNSGASNFAPSSADFLKAVTDRVTALRADGANAGPVPADLVTGSASGLDPDISPAAAQFQVERVATARQLDAKQLSDLILENTTSSDFGFLGQSRINVLALNRALDKLSASNP